MHKSKGVQVFSGYCPDPECKKQLFFPSYLGSSVECTSCGQHHEKKALLDVKPVSDPGVAIRNLLQNILISSVSVAKKCPESVKVKGLSNYRCKLISPLLTTYGLDKASGTVKKLSEMGQGAIFDCRVLSDRSFQIEDENLNVAGYGLDKTGAQEYLSSILNEINLASGTSMAIAPIHADGDGHCLVHAISRAIVGRELFWHPLMANLKRHLITYQDRYKMQFEDFIDEAEWQNIIAEAGPDYEPTNGEPLGLRNIHIFGLANVLKRPIVLLDGEECYLPQGHYSGVYLPAFHLPNECQNHPLVIAWSSSGRNHFVPLIGIKGKPMPKIPRTLMPVPWGVNSDLMYQYIKFEQDGSCIIGGTRGIQDKYLHKLVTSMETKFQELYHISPELVTDVYQHVLKPSGVVGVTPQLVIESTQLAVEEERLYRCLTCFVVIEDSLPVPRTSLTSTGQLYQLALKTHGKLSDIFSYRFPEHNDIVCRYDKNKDRLVPVKDGTNLLCKFCQGPIRIINENGTIRYFNGDRTLTPSGRSRCGCGYKHYWDGKEYDNLPERIKVVLDWNNVTREDWVYWFQYENDPSLNSNAYEMAQDLIQKHFPGEFGSERLKQRVVDQIFRQTMRHNKDDSDVKPSLGDNRQSVPSKIILTGEKMKSIHKEELGMSQSEKILKKKVEHAAAVQQKRSGTSPIKAKAQGARKIVPAEATVSRAVENATPSVPSPTPTTPSPSPSKEKKIRLSVANATHVTVALSDSMTFDDLQSIIEERLGVPKQLQILKVGFPPRILEAPLEEHKNAPLTLQHGERLLIDRKPPPQEDIKDASMQEEECKAEKTAKEPSEQEKQENMPMKLGSGNTENYDTSMASVDAEAEAYAAVDRMFLSMLGESNLWDWAQDKPYLFRPRGLFYNQAQKDLGPLADGQHCLLPCFPDKVFSYNKGKDELQLCLGKLHIPVQPISSELSAKMQERESMEEDMDHSSYISGTREVATIGGRTRREHKIVAFSGKGRSLSEDDSAKSDNDDHMRVMSPMKPSIAAAKLASDEISTSPVHIRSSLSSPLECIEEGPMQQTTSMAADSMEVDKEPLQLEASRDEKMPNAFQESGSLSAEKMEGMEDQTSENDSVRDAAKGDIITPKSNADVEPISCPSELEDQVASISDGCVSEAHGNSPGAFIGGDERPSMEEKESENKIDARNADINDDKEAFPRDLDDVLIKPDTMEPRHDSTSSWKEGVIASHHSDVHASDTVAHGGSTGKQENDGSGLDADISNLS